MDKQSLITTRTLSDVPAVASEAYSRPFHPAEPQTGSLLDYWQAISRRKFRLGAFGLVGLAIGLGAAAFQSPMYRASTSLEVQDAKEENTAAKILNPQPEATTSDALTDIQTQVKILQSQTLIDRALAKAHVNSVVGSGGRGTDISPWLEPLAMFALENNHDSLIESVQKHLKVSVANETRIVEVSYEASDPNVAARFVNVLTAEYMEQNLEARLQMNRKTTEWLVSQLDEARGKLQHSEDALQAYARQKGLIYTGDKQNISEEKLRELQAELSRAQADRVEKQSRYEIARDATPESIPEVLNDNNLRAMENNLVDLRKQDAEMGVTFKPDYAPAKKLQAEIESLESDIEKQRRLIVHRLDNELNESKRREQLLASAYSSQTGLVTDDSQKSIQYDMLKNDVDTNRRIYEVMLQRVKESSIASALKATNVRVIDPAKAPRHPFKPNLPMDATAGLLFGLMLGVTGIVVQSKADGTIQEPGDAAMLLGIPELGIIPENETGLSSMSPMRRLVARKSADNQNRQLITSANRSSLVADSVRAVLASILFASARQRQRVLVVTSASPGEGKTTTTSNLAVTLANMGRKVLLIDGDIRSPRIHAIFGLDNSVGLTTTLQQLAIKNVLTDTFIRETEVTNLQVLTSGPAVQAGADLLFSTLMPTLIAKYKGLYDIVLIDTPPMLVMPDARALGRLADSVVLIARAGRTHRSALQAAYQRFAEDRTPVLGVVLNGWNASMSAHNYYAAYKESEDGAVVRATPIHPSHRVA